MYMTTKPVNQCLIFIYFYFYKLYDHKSKDNEDQDGEVEDESFEQESISEGDEENPLTPPPDHTPLSEKNEDEIEPEMNSKDCLLYTSPSPRDRQKSRMPSSA